MEKNKADKSASNSLNPSILEGLVPLCEPDADRCSGHLPHASGHIHAERFLCHRSEVSCEIKNIGCETHQVFHNLYFLRQYDSRRSSEDMLYVQPSPDCTRSLFVSDEHMGVLHLRTKDLIQSVDRLDMNKHISLFRLMYQTGSSKARKQCASPVIGRHWP